MLSYDIPINININADSEKEAEEYIVKLMKQEMSIPALQRQINSWDFIVFVEEELEE